MRRPGTSAAEQQPSGDGWGLPRLDELLAGGGAKLTAHGEIGLISVTVLQRRHLERGPGWHAYDAIVREIGAFLTAYRKHRMRREDRLFEPSVNGNSFAVVLEPPRHGRSLEIGDLARVRARLRRGLKVHLARHLSHEVGESFGWYVGAALIGDSSEVPFERIVHRALEESFADALREKEREGRRHAVQLARVLHLGLVRSVYQPVVDIVDQRVIGFEALTRVGSGRFENIEMLFKAAEANDALWSLERLCRRKALEGLPQLGGDQLLFLNIEPDSIHDPQLAGPQFLEGLADAGLSPRQVVLELTEHSAVKDFVAFRCTLERFRALGFRLAMDDVGSGYAGLQAIAEIAPDFIKADMQLVRGIHESSIKRELIDTIRRFSDSTGITLVAEGVESPEELAALVAVGVRCAQGYLFARPGSPPSFPDWDAMREGT
jgi:EAL domain-containing protein (putative c-di-GMP-specific phosphodiesterase class I)